MTGSAFAVESGCVANSAVSEGLVDDPSLAFVVTYVSGTGSVAVAELGSEPHSFAVKTVDGAHFVPAAKSLDEPDFAAAAAVMPVDVPCPAFGQPLPGAGVEAEKGPVDDQQAEEGLKCFEWRMGHCEDS